MFYNWNEKPPTLKAILESIVNFEREEKVGVSKLARLGREKIFSFDYELSEVVSKEEFECAILNHFIDRRIGFETVGAFKLKLENKLVEIMPIANKMFDAMSELSVLESGEKTIREKMEKNNYKNKTNSTTNQDSENDSRNSDTPQNKIENVKNGSYVSNYSFDTFKNKTSNDSENNSDDDLYLKETITKTSPKQIESFINFSKNVKSVYTYLFEELECLFYNLY